MALKISTKGRYALRVLADLTVHDNGDYISLKSVAERQQISEKYLEAIISAFSKGKIVKGQRGKGGGYKLAVDPKTITVKDVLLMVEGDLAPVACLSKDAEPCPKAEDCKTLPMWKEYYKMTEDFFDSITVADIAEDEDSKFI